LDYAAIAEFVENDAMRGVALSLPRPEGGFTDFVLEDAGTMAPGLAAKFPEIRSLRGRDAAGNAVRVNLSSLGFQAMVFDRDGGSYVVEPETFGGRAYLAFRRSAVSASRDFRCEVHGDQTESADTPPRLWDAPQPHTTTGANLRNMRTVVAATGEYTAVFGGTVAGGQAAIVTAMNRVNQIYEAEFSVHMTLVANNDLVVYTNATTDPYTNNNGSTMLGQNITNLNTVIGSANFDIGHVFSTGGGGVAGLGVICGSSKARGVTGLPNPVGDPFYVDYVAHEMGHQYGGDHTFNSTQDACGGGNRVSASAYETGSGSTIMAYAGICGSDDLQPNSDPYFHARSLEQINTRLNATTCGTITPNPNLPPVIPALTGAYVIPAKTPFALTAPVASDADGDTLTYGWEEYDRAGATTIGVDNGTSPIARSYNPTTSPTRRVPRQQNLVANTFAPGEILPQVARTAMKYRLTVRDNHPGGGATVSADLPSIQVVATAAPFAVTAPNTAVTWLSGTTENVTWDVGGTDAAPIACAAVDVTLSTDGGATFPTILAAAAPNTGSAAITVPAIASTTARVRVKCATSIFFDISNANFTTVVAPPQPASLFKDGFEFDATPLATVSVTPTATCGISVATTPVGLVCSAAAGGEPIVCSGDFLRDAVLTLQATRSGANCAAAGFAFSGACTETATDGVAQMTMTGPQTCNVTLE
ncbi:MAG TPA: zinc-dependent metalloprotease family protein, partial [Tahibacter sp.]|nr:zinc-dependent metalloprotease family protein [Tahibacter sp.]